MSNRQYQSKEGVSPLCKRRTVELWVRTPAALLCSHLDKYPWERYEPPFPSLYGLDSTTSKKKEGFGIE